MRVLATILAVCALTGCATIGNTVVMSDATDTLSDYLVDRTGPDNYPSFMAAEGNIYSCRYGIHHQSMEEFSPPKSVMFGSLLRKELPDISSRQVVLHRFDVYHNRRLRTLKIAGSGMGGAIGSAISDVGNVNKDVFSFEKLQVERNPGTFIIPEENMVGCDKAREGEYYASQISGGHDVIVTWLEFSVDSTEHKFRTFYQFQPPTQADVAPGIDEAIRMSIRAVAKQIQ